MATYSFMIGLGASLAVLRVIQQVPRWQSSRWSNAALFCLLTGLLGARLIYVILQWSYYQSHFFESFAIWKGGLTWAGAILGTYFGCWFMAKRWKMTLLKMADGLAPMIPPLVMFIWLGCWLGGYAYGWEAPQGAFWGVPSLDETGLMIRRFPLQLVAAATMLIFAFWMETQKTPLKEEGEHFAVMQLGMAVNLLIFTTFRSDVSPILLGLRLDLLAALAFFVFSAALFYWLFFASKLDE